MYLNRRDESEDKEDDERDYVTKENQSSKISNILARNLINQNNRFSPNIQANASTGTLEHNSIRGVYH